MKRLPGIIFLVAFFVFAFVKIIHDFFANDGIQYFSRQPHQLLFAATIGIVGGLIIFGFSALPWRLRRGIKLAALAAGGSLFLAAGGYLSFQAISLQIRPDPTSPQISWLLAAGTLVVAGFLWFGFCQVLRSRDCSA